MLANKLEIKWPCNLPATLIDKLLGIAEPKKGISAFKVVEQYTQFPGVFYVLKGNAGICFSTTDMRKITGGVIGREDWLGASSVDNDNQFYCIAEEIETLEMLFFAKEKLKSLAEQEPLVYSFLFHALQKQEMIWMQTLLSTIHTREQKIIYTLLQIRARQINIEGAVDCIHISQLQLSTITGVSRSRLNETLKRLESQGYISLERHKIYILDLPGLTHTIKLMNLMEKDPRRDQKF